MSSPIKKKLEELKTIKNTRPTEYDGPEAIKTFVDKNYDNIMKASKILEKEPSKMTRDEIVFLITFIAATAGLIVLMKQLLLG